MYQIFQSLLQLYCSGAQLVSVKLGVFYFLFFWFSITQFNNTLDFFFLFFNKNRSQEL